MKGGAKKKIGFEAPIDASAAIVTTETADFVNGSNGCTEPLVPSGENDETLKGHEEGGGEEETQFQDSEGEVEEGAEEEEDEEDKDYGDLVPNENQGPKLDDGFYEIEAIRRKRVRKVKYLSVTELSLHFLIRLLFRFP